jgi:SAM-dependent methyltransferase
MKLLTNDAILNLRRELDARGYINWYKTVSHDCYDLDPWRAFSEVRHYLEQERGDRDLLTELFVLELPVSEDALTKMLGASVQDLTSTGFFLRTCQGIVSRYCLLSGFEKYLLVEYPETSHGGMLVSRDTYLSGLSYSLIRQNLPLLPHRRVHDLGTGTGLFSILASTDARSVIATDLDPSALRLAQANVDLNRCTVSTLQADMFNGIADEIFDLIVFNPPWRLVPLEIAYPNPLARVGTGLDGLNPLRIFLEKAPAVLSPVGRATFVIEFPGDKDGFEFAQELQDFAGASGCSVILSFDPVRRVDEQAWASAETALYLNKDFSIEQLASRFLSNYDRLGYSFLHPCLCEVRNDGQGKVLYLNQATREFSSPEIEDPVSVPPV